MEKQKVGVRLVYHGVVCSKKNSKRIIRNKRTGRMGIISSKTAKANEDDMILQFKTQCPHNDVPSPVRISIDMFEPNRTRRDLDNQATSILDALTRSGCIEDDSIAHIVELNVRFSGVDKLDPRAVVHIEHAGVAYDKN